MVDEILYGDVLKPNRSLLDLFQEGMEWEWANLPLGKFNCQSAVFI